MAGGNYDGLPNNTDSDESTSIGVVPEGRWKAVSLESTEDTFKLEGPELAFTPVGEEASYKGLFNQDTLMFQRTLELKSDATTSPNLIEANRILGIFTESISATNATHLSAEETGTMILLRDITRPPDDVSLTDFIQTTP